MQSVQRLESLHLQLCRLEAHFYDVRKSIGEDGITVYTPHGPLQDGGSIKWFTLLRKLVIVGDEPPFGIRDKFKPYDWSFDPNKYEVLIDFQYRARCVGPYGVDSSVDADDVYSCQVSRPCFFHICTADYQPGHYADDVYDSVVIVFISGQEDVGIIDGSKWDCTVQQVIRTVPGQSMQHDLNDAVVMYLYQTLHKGIRGVRYIEDGLNHEKFDMKGQVHVKNEEDRD